MFLITYCYVKMQRQGQSKILSLTFMGPCIVIVFQYISSKMQHYTVYFIWKLLYMFRVVPSPSSGAQTTVSAASGIFHTVIAICRYCGRVGTGLSVLTTLHTYSCPYTDITLLDVKCLYSDKTCGFPWRTS